MMPTETSSGYCHVCGNYVIFTSYEPLDLPCKRNTFFCPKCGSCGRNRHLAATILDLIPAPTPDGRFARVDDLEQFAERWRGEVLLTCTSGAIHSILARQSGCTASEYIDDTPSGATRDGVLCQDLQRTSFEDDCFDLIVTEDVMEHIPNPEQAYAEIRRILKPGGYHIATIPVNWSRTHSVRRATIANGEVVHFMPPEYHGDPTRAEGILAFSDYGHDLIDKYLTITGPSWMHAAHGDRKMEEAFGIFDSWVFVSQKRKPSH